MGGSGKSLLGLCPNVLSLNPALLFLTGDIVAKLALLSSVYTEDFPLYTALPKRLFSLLNSLNGIARFWMRSTATLAREDT